MPETSLRAYGRDIDELIERERLDEAIAHCRHILQTYPKHLETYRLLGKAYLEAKRYGDAADIFQRVLSAVPDDFVSHIGMAIVREDEGNLDAAIWHMERAFETNPSNPAIQQEMKRLISRRDGLEPHKVRLTRGALARMYAHGELYAQAIAELRSALQEDAERPDLQVLLAGMYWQTNQRTEATSVSNQILEKLPYCQEANRILAANLQASDRIEEAAVYHRRLAGLDPYAAFVESALEDPSTVEETAVTLEQLEWQPGEPLPTSTDSQPGWAATLGMEMQEPTEDTAQAQAPAQTGPLPSWLEPGEPPPFEAAAEKELREDFESDEGEFIAEFESDETGLDDSAPAIRDTDEVPEVGARSPETEGPAEEGGIGAGAVAAAGVAAGMFASRDEDDEGAGLQVDELEPDATVDDTQEVGPPAAAAAAVAGGQDDGEPDRVAQEDGAESDIPDWMQEAGWTESTGEAVETPVSFSDEELESLDAGRVPTEQPEEGELAPAQLPDWIQDIPHDEAADIPGGTDDGDLPGWLAVESAEEEGGPPAESLAEVELAEGQGIDDGSGELETETDLESSFPAAESDGKDLPTWITEDSPGATETIVTWLEDRDEPSTDLGAAETGEIPDWMEDTGALEERTGLDDETTEKAPPVAETPVEAEESEATETEADIEPEQDFAPSTADSDVEVGPETPGWLTAVAAVAAHEEAAKDEVPLAEEVADDAPDWPAEAVEADPGVAETESVDADFEPEPGDEAIEIEPAGSVPEGEPVSTLAEADIEPEIAEPAADIEDSGAPEWLQEIGTAPLEPVAAEIADLEGEIEEDSEVTPVEPGAETPEWLRGLAEEGADAEPADIAAAPDWLRDIAEPGSVDAEAELGQAEAPDWLEGVAEEQDEPVSEATAADRPHQGETEPPSVEEEPVEVLEVQEPQAPVPAEEDDEVMEWLEDLAAKQDEAPTEEDLATAATVEPAAPVMEERSFPEEPEEGLEWLESLADERGLDLDVSLPEGEARPAPESAPEQTEEAEEPEAETAPDWLNVMATQPLPKLDTGPIEEAAIAEAASDLSPDEQAVEVEAEQVDSDIEEIREEQEAEAPQQVAPDDVTIQARASDLQADMEAIEAEQQVSAEADEDEIPDWLVAAAAQGDVTPEATTVSGLEPELEAPEPEQALEDVASPPLDDAGLSVQEPTPVEEQLPVEEVAAPPAEIPFEEAAEVSAAAADVEPLEPAQVVAAAPDEVEIVGEPEVLGEKVAEVAEPEPEAAEEAVERPVAEKAAPDDPSRVLELARQALASGETEEAVELYSDLVKHKESLESIVEDLRIALDRNPTNVVLWQALGDAYMRNDQTDEAIEAYRKGMEAA